MVTTTNMTVAQGKALMRSPRQRTHGGGSWRGWCCAFGYWFSGAAHSYDTAYDAYQASGPIVSKDYAKAPAGAWHYWKSVSSFRPGHVAPSLGNGIAAMATAQSVDEVWGVGTGTVRLSRYIPAVKASFVYLGWNYNFGAFRMRGVQTLADVKASTKVLPKSVKVKSGDTLGKISSRYKVSVPKLVALNKAAHPSLAKNADLISVGWTIKLK